MAAQTQRKNKISGRRPSKWKDEFILTAYECARSGLKNVQIAKTLGVDYSAFKGYMRKRPLFAQAIERGREYRSGERGMDFAKYVYKRLPDELQVLWDDIHACVDEPNGLARMEAMLEKKGKRTRQHLFIHALVVSNFNASEACRLVNIPYITFKKWMVYDPRFEELMKEIEIHRKNFIEGSLMDLVATRDPAAVIFANKCANGDRGYNPGRSTKIDVNHSGSVEQRHTVDDLGLPLEARIAIKNALKARSNGTVIEATAKRITAAELESDDDSEDEDE